MHTVLFDVSKNIAFLRLNRPEVYNSFNREMAMLLQSLLDKCEGDTEIRCLVITGEGKAFSAGQDLNEAIDPEGPEIGSIVANHYNPIIRKIREMEKPVVAAVNGVAAGAGANIALACDLCIARESATFIQAFANIGLIPDSGGTYHLPRLIGMARATALAMLGEKLPANEAEKIGMIYKCVPDDEFDVQVMQLSTKLAAMPTTALGMTKRAFNYSFDNDLDRQLAIEEQLQATAAQTSDYSEGVKAFIEKRKPKFTGK